MTEALAEQGLLNYTRRVSKGVDFANENIGLAESWGERDARDDARSRETADLAYLRERWPGASEDVLLEAVAILNGVRVNQ